jgi:hypothetical protein
MAGNPNPNDLDVWDMWTAAMGVERALFALKGNGQPNGAGPAAQAAKTAAPAAHPKAPAPSAVQHPQRQAPVEEESDHVSMHLPEDPVIDEPETVITARKHPFTVNEEMIIKEGFKRDKDAQEAAKDAQRKLDATMLDGVVTRIQLLQLKYTVMTNGACGLFSRHAKKRFAENPPEVSAWELLGPVLSVVGSVLAVEVAGAVALGEFGKLVLEKTLDEGSKAFIHAAGEMLKSEKDLDKAVDGITEKSQMIARALTAKSNKVVLQPMIKLAADLKSNASLDDNQKDLIGEFHKSGVDKVLESFGLPKEMIFDKIEAKVFAAMVESFEKEWIRAYHEEHEPGWPVEERSVERAAKQKAAEALQELDDSVSAADAPSKP